MAFSEQAPTSLHLIYHGATINNGPSSIAHLIDQTLASASASAAFVYQRDFAGSSFVLTSIGGSVRAPSMGRLAVEFRNEKAARVYGLRAPFDVAPANDSVFGQFPEVLQYRFGRLLVAPLTEGTQLAGLLTVGRIGAEAFDVEDKDRISSLVQIIAAPLANVLLRTRLADAEDRIADLERKLEERKLIERAKGLLQEQGATEETAYLSIRRRSRQRRIPMADVAREIIAGVEQSLRMTA